MKEIVGGQALIEGVMMRKGDRISTALIKDDMIKVRTYKIRPLTKRYKIFALPFIRGIFSLLDMTYVGMKEMIYSANNSTDDDSELKTSDIVISIVLSFVFAILIFKVLPLWITKMFYGFDMFGENRLAFNLFDGILRIGMFVLYIYLVSLFPDIRRVFEYHGAEHKTVHAHEHGDKLTVKNVMKYTTIHPRCGTSFLFIVLFIAILVFSIVPINLPFFLLLALRIPLIFPIAGISYEILKISSKYEKNIFFRLFILPGKLIQKITTREPDKRQIEVAIEALKPLISNR